MSSYTHLVDNVSKLEYVLSNYIIKKQTKNISKKESNLLSFMELSMNNIKSIIANIECDVSKLIVNNATTEGKVSQLIDILRLCHQDYSLHGKTNEATIIYNTLCSI